MIHCNINYGVLKFKIHFPPPDYLVICNYKDTISESVQKTISAFVWLKAFHNRNSNKNENNTCNFIERFQKFH